MKWMLLYVSVAFVGFTAGANALGCCEPGFYMRRNLTAGAIYCRNNVTNATHPSALTCEHSVMFSEKDMFFNVSDDGDVVLWTDSGPEVIKGVCVGEISLKMKGVNQYLVRRAVGSCQEKDPVSDPDGDAARTKAYCMLISVAFLYATALIYAGLPELRDLQGKSIVNLCASLGTALLIIAIQNLTTTNLLDSAHCFIRAYLGYVFLIAAFFWMNAISIQIIRNLRRPMSPDYGWKEFLWYALYAWGMAVALTILVAVLDTVDGPHIRAGIGKSICWFDNTKEMWAYVYSVILIIVVVNTAIFIYVSVTLWRSTFTSDHVKALRFKFCMMIRLYLIMGVPWIFEMITSSVEQHIITTIIDICNCLIGVLFFVVLVVWRMRAIKALHKRNLFCCLSDAVERIIARAEDAEAEAIAHTAVMSLEQKN